jgi:ribose transport system substrate-binding protein
MALLALILAAPVGVRAEGAATSDLAAMQARVTAATARAAAWDGPRTGPAAVTDRRIALLAEDLRNGGILGVAQGVQEAAREIGWTVRVFDAGGTPAGRDRAAVEALASRPDGLVVVGADAEAMRARLEPFAARGVPIVGWHVGPRGGAMSGGPVAMNVSTDPLEVARVTAMAAVVAARGKAGVVIFTDSNFQIAMKKASTMAEVIRACPDCTLLEVRDVPISRAAELMPAVARELIARHGARWTHALAINDIYFDYAVPELTRAGEAARKVQLLSAGDGSQAAFLRIQAGVFQVGTVGEPLTLHGWQLVDELNRLLARQPVTGHVFPVHLSTPDNIGADGGPRLLYDPDNGYRSVYRRIWRP